MKIHVKPALEVQQLGPDAKAKRKATSSPSKAASDAEAKLRPKLPIHMTPNAEDTVVTDGNYNSKASAGSREPNYGSKSSDQGPRYMQSDFQAASCKLKLHRKIEP